MPTCCQASRCLRGREHQWLVSTHGETCNRFSDVLNDNIKLNVVPVSKRLIDAETIQSSPFTRPRLDVFFNGCLEDQKLLIWSIQRHIQDNVELSLGRPGPVHDTAGCQRTIGEACRFIRRQVGHHSFKKSYMLHRPRSNAVKRYWSIHGRDVDSVPNTIWAPNEDNCPKDTTRK